MKLSTVCCLASLTVLLLLVCRSDSNALCPPCLGDACDAEPVDCSHGIVRDYCGRKVCAKGPGQKCGGPSNILGRCGEGMHCKCEKCAGCSLATLECDLSEYLCL